MYKIEISHSALKFLQKQTPQIQERIFRAIYKLPAGDTKILKGLKAVYRLRVGDYRVIYKIDNDILLISVIGIGNRGQVYKDF